MRDLLSRTRPVRRVRALVSSIAVIALAIGGVLVTTLPAQAHDAVASTDCTSVRVQITSGYGGGSANLPLNTITIAVDGAVVSTTNFADFPTVNPVVYQLADPTKPHTVTVDVVQYHEQPTTDTSGNHHFDFQFTPCAVPTVQLSATTCTTVGGNADVTAQIGSLLADDSHRVDLISGGTVVDSRTIAAGPTSTTVDYPGLTAGAAYTVKVTDLQQGLVGSADVTTASCPEVGGIQYEIAPCTAPGGSSTLTLTPDLVENHTYQVRRDSATGAVLSTFVFHAGSTYQVPVTGTGDLSIYVVDVQGGLVSASLDVTLAACPTLPTVVTVTPAPCTIGATSSNVVVDFAGLTPGRTYQPLLDGAPVGLAFQANGSTASRTLADVAPGSHTVGIRDDTLPTLVSSAAVTVPACAQLPHLEVTAEQCTTVPAQGETGTGGLDAEISGLVAGRSYLVSVTSNGEPVAVDGLDAPFQAESATASVPISDLPAGTQYTVKVVDTAEEDASASVTVSLADCPPMPEVGGASIECTSTGGVSTLTVGATDLAAGETWDITFERLDTAGYVTVASRSNLTNVTAADLSYSGVRPGETYRVTLTAHDNPNLSSVEEIVIPATCTSTGTTDPNTNGQVDALSITANSLAVTGMDTTPYLAAALLLLLAGTGVTVYTVRRRRREEADA